LYPCSSKTFEIYCVELCSYLSFNSHSKIYAPRIQKFRNYIHLCTNNPIPLSLKSHLTYQNH
jgi:hypothetical protein